jgi:hypothetical protein
MKWVEPMSLYRLYRCSHRRATKQQRWRHRGLGLGVTTAAISLALVGAWATGIQQSFSFPDVFMPCATLPIFIALISIGMDLLITWRPPSIRVTERCIYAPAADLFSRPRGISTQYIKRCELVRVRAEEADYLALVLTTKMGRQPAIGVSPHCDPDKLAAILAAGGLAVIRSDHEGTVLYAESLFARGQLEPVS